MIHNDRLLRALRRQPVDKTPIWIMRQAGRYLPEYRQVRAQAGSFMTLCTTPELACEVTLQPLRRFELDAAILFSDILTIPDAMGLGLYFEADSGPKFQRTITTAAEVRQLAVPDPEQSLRYVMDAIRLVQHELAGKVPLLGFSGSPWTLATYMVQGGSSKNFEAIKRLLWDEPDTLHQLLAVLAQAVAEYLKAQIAAGVNAVMIFDTWGGVLTPQDYAEFSLAYIRQIVQQLKTLPLAQQVPVIVFTKGGGQWASQIADCGCEAIGLDWTVNLGDIRQQVGQRVALQGNLDPCVLYASPSRIQTAVQQVLASFGSGSGHVFNLGHGINPDVNPERVQILVDAVHEFSIPYHTATTPLAAAQ